jgi:hypothetical protein
MAVAADDNPPWQLLALGVGLIAFAWIQWRYLDRITYFWGRRRYGPEYGELRRGCSFYVLVVLGLVLVVVAGVQYLQA